MSSHCFDFSKEAGKERAKEAGKFDVEADLCWDRDISLQERAVRLVEQFLDECGHREALEALVKSSGIHYKKDLIPEGGRLLSLVQEHEEMKELERRTTAAAEEDKETVTGKTPVVLEDQCDNIHPQSGKDSFAVVSGKHKGTVIALTILRDESQSSDAEGSPFVDFVTSGSDKNVVLTRFHNDTGKEETLWTTCIGSPALCFSYCRETGQLAASAMDGSLVLLDVGTGDIVQRMKPHMKYVVCVVWATPDVIVTASRDHTACILSRKTRGDEFEVVHTYTFEESVECLCALKEAEGDVSVLASVRGDNYIHKFGITDHIDMKYLNLNETGDDWVSFTVLHMSLDPREGRVLLVSTDKDRLIGYDLEKMALVRNLYGAPNDEYSQPAHCWVNNGQYVASSSQDGMVYLWSIHSQRVVAQLKGHRKVVRSLVSSQNGDLFTASYDGTIRVWKSTPFLV